MQEVLVMLEAKSVVLQDGVGQLLAQMGAVRHKRKRNSKKVRCSLLVYVSHGSTSVFTHLFSATGLWVVVQRRALVVLLLRPRYGASCQLLYLEH